MNISRFYFLFITFIIVSNPISKASEAQEKLLKESMRGTLTSERIDELLHAGACLYEVDPFGNNALFLSTAYAKTTATLALILKNADCDKKGYGIITRCPNTTLLHVVAKNSSLPIQKQLSFHHSPEEFELNVLAHLYFFVKNHVHPLLKDDLNKLPHEYAQGVCQKLLYIYTAMYKKHKRLGFTKKMLNLYWKTHSNILHHPMHWFNIALQLNHRSVVRYYIRTQRAMLEEELKNISSKHQMHIVTQKNTFNMREAWYQALKKYEQS